MALTVTVDNVESYGSLRAAFVRVAFDNSYPTGGETLTANACGLDQIYNVTPTQVGGYILQPIYANVLPSEVALRVYTGGEGGFTPAGSVAFTGTAPGTAFEFQVAYQAAPSGDNVFVKTDGQFFRFSANTSSGDSIVPGVAGGAIQVTDESVASNAIQVYFDDDGANIGERLIADLTAIGAPTFVSIPTPAGGVARVYHDVDAATNGTALTLSAGNAFESANAGTANANFAQSTDVWLSGAPVGTATFTGTPVAGAPADQVPNGTDLSTALAEVQLVVVGK